jgi:hypothetical protein
VPLANAAVRVYKREINWVEKEEYGDLYHFRMGVNSNLGELLYEGTTDSQGNIKFKVDPQKEDENLLYLVLSKEGFLDKTRHLFGDEDLEAKTLILSQDNEEMNSWLYYKLCNHGYQPMDVHAYLQGCNVSLPYQIYENSLLPEIVVVIKDDEYVASEVLNAIPVAMKYLLGEGVKISYAKERGVVQDNKFYIEFWDEPGGQAWINMVPLSNLVRVSGMYIDRNYRGERTMSVFVHEGGHALIFVNAHEEDSNSQYGDDENFINYPYFSGSDNAVQSLILDVVGNIMPGDKYDFENGIFKQESLSAEKDGYIYYIHLE